MPALKISMEAIGFQQNSALFNELTIFYGNLMSGGLEGQRSKTLDAMAESVLKHTGINTTFTLLAGATGIFMVAIPPLLHDNPINNKSYTQRLSNLSLDAMSFKGIFKGGIDLKGGKVDGDFSKIMYEIYLDLDGLSQSFFTPEEAAATTLHEIGHVFTNIYLMSSMFRTNLVMQEIGKIFDRTRETKVRIDSLTVVEKLYGAKFEDKAALANNNDTDAVAIATAGLTITSLRSELGTRYYDERLGEFVADQFATRHGAGAHLVSALDKLGALYKKKREYQSVAAGWGEVLGLGVLAALLSPAVATAGFSGGVLGCFIMALNKRNKDEKVYDEPSARFAAIEREIISILKDSSLPNHVVRKLLMDIDSIRRTIAGLTKYNYPLQRGIEFLVGTWNGERREIKFQRDLEKLGNNSLFVDSAKLSTLQDKG